MTWTTRINGQLAFAGVALLAFAMVIGCGSDSAGRNVDVQVEPSAAHVAVAPDVESVVDDEMSMDGMAVAEVETELLTMSVDEITADDIRGGREAFVSRPIDRAAMGFTLTNQDGDEVRLEDFRGQWVVMDWIYTNCMTVCPALTGEMLKVKDSLGEKLGSQVQLVTLTFDFERDDVEAMKTYAWKVGGDVTGWSWLTGDRSLTDPVAEAYGVSYTPAPAMMGVAMFDHTALTVVIDPAGRERFHYYGVGWGEDMSRRLESLVPDIEAAAPAKIEIDPDQPLAGLSADASEKLSKATTYFWERWELEPGITMQSVHNFAGRVPTARYFQARMSGLEENGWVNLGKEDASGEAFGQYYMFEGPDSSFIGVGTNENVMVEVRGNEFAETLDTLFWLGDALCCPA